MKAINIHQVDVFTDQLFGGNPAGVVTNADMLSDEEMGKIAREMNLSETVFVLQPTSAAADIKLRYFTCGAAELDFCGHATVAAIYELARLNTHGLDKQGVSSVRVENGAGILELSVLRSKNDIKVRFVAPAVKIKAYRLQGGAFADAFGVPVGALRPNSLILIDDILNYMYVPITSLSQLGDLQFNFAKIRQNFQEENVIIFCLYASETFDNKADLHARVTGPLLGLDEDPVSGSTQSGLVHAAKQIGAIPTMQKTITTEQGHFMKRPSSVEATHDVVTDTVSVMANCVHVFSTSIEL